MKKLILILMFGLSLVNADTEFKKNDNVYIVRDKDYVIRCIEKYKWIQFIEPLYGKGGTFYNASGNPQQMFIKNGNSSIPVECDEEIKK